jgi:tRNA (guanine6-N2)-methyltransferase
VPSPRRPAAKPATRPAPTVEVELSCLPGLADVVVRELHARIGGGRALKLAAPRTLGTPGREDAVALHVPRPSLTALHDLRTVVAVQRVLRYGVPRPKALLGDALQRQLLADVAAVVAEAAAVGGAAPGAKGGGAKPFRALRLEAAGRDSDVMRRLAAALAEGVGLPLDPEEGDLVVRARPEGEGWALLVRTTRRPLSARPWRVCDRPGGLNASLAAALAWLAAPPGGVVALNAFAGSGTLAIELALADPRARVEGIDTDPEAVACARRNAAAAGVEGRVRFEVGDATGSARPDGSVDLVLADPPWGDAVGSRERNRALYPAFLAEAARSLRPGGRLAWVTHEVALTEALLRERGPWRVVHERRVWHGGHHPTVLVLERGGRA